MNYDLKTSSLKINDINLWAKVGVFDEERLTGQAFLLDITIWLDVEQASQTDEVAKSVDYSLAVINVQKLSKTINCFTIEHFSLKILDLLESVYGSFPMEIILTKCSPPINGFNGSVSIKRNRHMNLIK